MKIFKKKTFLSAIIITGAVILLGILFPHNNFISSGIKTLFTPILTVTSDLTLKIKEGQSYFTELRAYKEKNQELVNELSEFKKNDRSVASYIDENKRLNDLLNLKNEMDERFKTIPAKIISYEPNNWFDTIVVNKGNWSDVNVGDCVICDSGVIGKVVSVGSGYSVISSILSVDNAIGVKIARTGEIAVVEGDDTLAGDKLCKMSFVEKSGGVNIGDLLVTTGTGGIYPENVNVGEVVEMKAVNSVLYAVVKPAVSFGDVHEVLILSSGGSK